MTDMPDNCSGAPDQLKPPHVGRALEMLMTAKEVGGVPLGVNPGPLAGSFHDVHSSPVRSTTAHWCAVEEMGRPLVVRSGAARARVFWCRGGRVRPPTRPCTAPRTLG